MSKIRVTITRNRLEIEIRQQIARSYVEDNTAEVITQLVDKVINWHVADMKEQRRSLRLKI